MPKPALFPERMRNATMGLFHYCQEQQWTGYDPYDGLNSQVFQSLRFLHYRVPRLVWTQLMKRSPLNLRKILRVPKSQNPKGIALFLTSILKLARLGLLTDEKYIKIVIDFASAPVRILVSLITFIPGGGYWPDLKVFLAKRIR